MKEFILGVIFGVLFIVFGVFLVLFKTRIVPKVSKINEEWPSALQEFIKRNLTRDDADHLVQDLVMSPTLDISWLNLIFTRLFLSLRSSNSYKQLTMERISRNMNRNLKKGLLVIYNI